MFVNNTNESFVNLNRINFSLRVVKQMGLKQMCCMKTAAFLHVPQNMRKLSLLATLILHHP